MKKLKRCLAVALTASMVAASLTAPALADEPDSSAVITKVTGTGYDGSQKKVTAFYANGNPVVVEKVGDDTYVHLEDDRSNSSWVKVEPDTAAGDTRTAVVAGNAVDTTDRLDSAKITMIDGSVNYLVGSSAGNAKGTGGYTIGTSEMIVKGGQIDFIVANRSLNNGNGLYADCEDQLVENAVIEIGGNTVVDSVYGCFGYTQIHNLDMTIKDNAQVTWSVLPGATNGKLGTGKLTVDGAGVTINDIGGCLRTFVDHLDVDLLHGTVEGPISVGSLYNKEEAAWKTSNWGLGDVDYGIVKYTNLHIGKDFNYQGIYGGFQTVPDDVKAFYDKFYNQSNANNDNIINGYGITPDGKVSATADIFIEAAPKGNAGTVTYSYYGGSSGEYGGVCAPNLLTTIVDGVTVWSAPKSITVTPEAASLRVGESKEATASLEMITGLASPANAAVEWISSEPGIVSVTPKTTDGSKAVITGLDIGAATVTASYTDERSGIKVEDTVQVSVGGDFKINVSPSKIRMGDTINFTAIASGSNAVRANIATASNADYDWSINDDRLVSGLNALAKKMTAKAIGAGNGTVTLSYTDDEGNTSTGHAAFTVEAPTSELDVPASVEVGKKIRGRVKVGNITGTAESLGLSTGIWGSDHVFIEIDDTGEFVAVDVPAKEEAAYIGGGVKYYSSVDGYTSTEVEKAVSVTLPVLSGETVYLDTENAKSKTIKLPTAAVNILDAGGDLEIASRNGNLIDVDYDLSGTVTFTAKTGAGSTEVDVILPSSGSVLVSYPAVVIDSSADAEAKDGKTEVVVPSKEELPTPEFPEGAGDGTVKEEFDKQVDKVKQSIVDLGTNTAVADNPEAIQNLSNLVLANGLLADGEKASVSLKQELKSAELKTVIITDDEGKVTGVKVVPQKLIFEVHAFKTLLDEDGNLIKGTTEDVDLSKGNIQNKTVFSFRLPIPSTVEEVYANVEHEGDGQKQYKIEGSGDGKYITVSAWHLSEFAVTFTNDKIQSGSGGNGGGSSRGGIRTTSNGRWIQDAKGWWFKKTDGTYPASQWYECLWNGKTNWYHFNAEGYMDDGWFTDADGRTYFLHNISDNTRGHMYTGWNWINGKCYYFETVKGSYLGHLYKNTTTPDGSTVNENGEWVVNGVVQTR